LEDPEKQVLHHEADFIESWQIIHGPFAQVFPVYPLDWIVCQVVFIYVFELEAVDLQLADFS
jgi:hypothetical protein